MNWTISKPTEPGYYWAVEKASQIEDIIKIEEINIRNSTCICFGYEIDDSIDNYLYFMGPINKPEIKNDRDYCTITRKVSKS